MNWKRIVSFLTLDIIFALFTTHNVQALDCGGPYLSGYIVSCTDQQPIKDAQVNVDIWLDDVVMPTENTVVDSNTGYWLWNGDGLGTGFDRKAEVEIKASDPFYTQGKFLMTDCTSQTICLTKTTVPFTPTPTSSLLCGHSCIPGGTYNPCPYATDGCTVCDAKLLQCTDKAGNPSPHLTPKDAVFNLCNTIPATQPTQQKACQDCVTTIGGVYTALGCLPTSPEAFTGSVLTLALGLGGGLALLLMLYGSFLVSTSAGNPEQSQKGKEVVTGAIMGLLFIIFSVVLLKLIGIDILHLPGF